MLNRSIPPNFLVIDHINISTPEIFIGSENQHFYYTQNLDLKVFRLEFCFSFGSFYSELPSLPFFISQLLLSGTTELTASQISSKLEYYGSQIECNYSLKQFTISLMGLSKFFEESLQVLHLLLSDAQFPQSELDLLKTRQIQFFKVQQEKTNVLCDQGFRKAIFDNVPVHGFVLDEASLMAVSRDQVKKAYTLGIKQAPYDIFLSGNVDPSHVSSLKKFENYRPRKNSQKLLPIFSSNPLFDIHLPKENALQSSIKIGKMMFGRKHPDFKKFMVFNTVFGGYFGSRLMKNIREEKGLTYGISSSLNQVGDSWLWTINSDVKKENLELVKEEIQRELGILQTELITENELETVKNYMSGSILSGTNSVFDISDKHKLMYSEGLSINFYDELLFQIHQTSVQDVLNIADKYCHDLSIYAVG